jgi:hypothetical protein
LQKYGKRFRGAKIFRYKGAKYEEAKARGKNKKALN